MSSIFIHILAWVRVIPVLALVSIYLLTSACHFVSHDQLPETWKAEDIKHDSGCVDISGVYRDESSEITSDCFIGRHDRVDKCTSSLSVLLLGEHTNNQPTHVEIQQSGAGELFIKLWKYDLLIKQASLLSEREEFSCTDDGVRIYWADDALIVPPFFGIIGEAYGTFIRTNDGALIMKRSDSGVILMWGIFPWASSFESQWIKWLPCIVDNPENVKISAMSCYASIVSEEKVQSLARLCQNADQGYMRARIDIGQLYLYGSDKYQKPDYIQIQADLPHACMWFQLAGQAIISEKKEYAEDSALERLCIAADKGDYSSRDELGRIYFFGSRGVSEDLTRAYMWYRLAEDAHVPHSEPYESAEVMRTSNVMTAYQLEEAKKLVQDWQPGQCSSDLRLMQKPCDAMTPEERAISIRLIEEWKPGMCENQLFDQ